MLDLNANNYNYVPSTVGNCRSVKVSLCAYVLCMCIHMRVHV